MAYQSFFQVSDLPDPSIPMQESWTSIDSKRQEWNHYFTGSVFKEKIPIGENDDPTTAPLMYPVGVNLCQMVVLAMADGAFGEWDENILTFSTRQDQPVDNAVESAIDLLTDIMEFSDANHMFWELEIDRQAFAGGVIKVVPSLSTPGYVKWVRIPVETFRPVWNPEDPFDILECYVVSEISQEQARLLYGIQSAGEIVKRVEHWDKQSYELHVDGKKLERWSGKNPWNVVPFVYIPRQRTTDWYGDSVIDQIMPIQDELNSRLADMGDGINYNSHPTRYGYNIPGSFDPERYPLGPNVFWDLGKVISDRTPPTVGILESKNPVPDVSFDYIKFIYNIGRVASGAPPIVFGDDDDASQRSGVTLEIRMMPFVRSIRRSRAYLISGLKRIIRITGMILQQKKIQGVSSHAIKRMLDGGIVPQFAPVMPRDQVAIVDEVVKRMSTSPPTISVETAVKKLGDGTSEVARIKDMLADEEYLRVMPEMPEEQNNESPPGSSGQSGAAPNKNEKTEVRSGSQNSSN